MDESDPWSVPVPVRPSSFIPLRPEHAQLNIEVDLARIAAFAPPGPRIGRDDLLYADLQVNADVNVPRRLGSGRAGCYRGYYLKGVGRTLLAANWNDADDWQHSSGTLPASAAIREFVASRYLEAVGAGETIVPCEGVLVRPHRGLGPPAIRIGDAVVRPPPVDERLHAITVKRAGFARWSNFVWLAGQLARGLAASEGFSVASFVERLARSLAPGAGDVGGLDPAALVARWQAAQLRTERAFRAFLRHGVYWGSFHNNHTIDGRFLDLEVPALIGTPFLGALSTAPGATAVHGEHPAVLVGIETGYVWEDLRAALVRLEAQLGAVAGGTRSPEQRFLRELRHALRRWLRTPGGPLARAEDRLERVVEVLCAELALSASAVPALRALLGPPLGASRRRAPAALRRLRALDLCLAPPEQAFAPRLFAFECLDIAPPCAERLALLNDLIRRLDACRDPDDLLAGLADAERTIARCIAREGAVGLAG